MSDFSPIPNRCIGDTTPLIITLKGYDNLSSLSKITGRLVLRKDPTKIARLQGTVRKNTIVFPVELHTFTEEGEWWFQVAFLDENNHHTILPTSPGDLKILVHSPL